MAVNSSHSMNADFHQGTIDESYIQLTPDRGNVENPPLERLTWPRYQHVGQWAESPFMEASIRHGIRPREVKLTSDTDTRF